MCWRRVEGEQRAHCLVHVQDNKSYKGMILCCVAAGMAQLPGSQTWSATQSQLKVASTGTAAFCSVCCIGTPAVLWPSLSTHLSLC